MFPPSSDGRRLALPRACPPRQGACRRPGLFVSFAYNLSGFRIDQMNTRADEARYGFIGIGTVIGRFVGDPALHLHAGIGAAVDERCH